MPCTPNACSADFTSSSLKGLITAVMSFMRPASRGPRAVPCPGPALRPSVPRGRFTGEYGSFPPGETAGRRVTQMFHRPGRPAEPAGPLAEDRVDERRRLERGEVVQPLAQSDQLDRYPELPLDRHHDPALGGA